MPTLKKDRGEKAICVGILVIFMGVCACSVRSTRSPSGPSAQDNTPKVSVAETFANQLMKKGDDAFNSGDFVEALNYYEQAKKRKWAMDFYKGDSITSFQHGDRHPDSRF
jgi:outer membrane protein assembly factor BamD (BamD/ComL family)